MYSPIVMEHFNNPRNIGVIEDADGFGEVGNPVCGDMMSFYIKVQDDVITDIKYQTFGCVAAIAVSSIVSEMAKGKTLDGGQEDKQKSRGRGFRRPAAEQNALLQSGGGGPDPGHRELSGKTARY